MEWEPLDFLNHDFLDAPRTYFYGMGTDTGDLGNACLSPEPTFME